LTERNQIALLDLGMVARVAPGAGAAAPMLLAITRTAEMTPQNTLQSAR